ncbi:MAG: hypothetical protein KJ799_04740 [Bacteroidetes bacterium]|nr:hypothetical protein [Bacteroidota bacterium]MBU1678995.1 hypothetical protein [Bacteroidota bacterium]MBU2506014.1 hypothetical protein [Bacteroidota bacterium]
MKKSYLKISAVFLLVFISVNIFANAILSDFQVISENGNVILNWQTSQEINLKHFIVERKSTNGPFMELGNIPATGDNSVYSFIDENAYKSHDAIYTYRLKIVDNDNTVSYSNEVSVSHSPSTVKRTWGSIKALFR